MIRFLLEYRRIWLLGGQLFVIAASLTAAFLLRFDFDIPETEVVHLYRGLLIFLPAKLLVFRLAGMQKGWMRFAGLPDLKRLASANLTGSVLASLLTLFAGSGFPRSIYVIDLLICFLALSFLRFAIRVYNEILLAAFRGSGRKRVLIYGAGTAGVSLCRELLSNKRLGYDIAGFIDDDPRKAGITILGIKVLGPGCEIAALTDPRRRRSLRVHEIIIAMPSATGREMREAVAYCRASGIACKTIPGMADLLNGKVSSQIRNIEITDLLGREPVQLETDRIREHIRNRSVLVTGGAGSIGSELCRQISSFGPKRLVIVDHAESDLFRIDYELRHKHPELEIVPEPATIRNLARLEEILTEWEIDAIFHAAAYKHVPMMEQHITEAVENNVLGTWNVVTAAWRHRITDLLMISSDKAVNPSSIMGLTKRISELLVAAQAEGNHWARWVSVRFGNVLGSNGSVVPIFQQQIETGGPVTVTHPEMRRYFMTIREAVQLVLQASTMGESADIFVLDMGQPVRIIDLAHNMIKLSGLVPNEDIEVRITGLRPGEKLFEELCVQDEHTRPTYHDKIKIFSGPVPGQADILRWLDELRDKLSYGDPEELVRHMQQLVPEYQGTPTLPGKARMVSA